MRPLREVLSANGALRHAHGSFNASGYRLVPGPGGAPRFVKATHAKMATASAAPVGASVPGSYFSENFGVVGLPNATIYAVAVSGANIYIGGQFTTASPSSGINYNNIAQWDGHAWHALGTGTNAAVRAIAVAGSNVYVGGSFTSAGGISANAVALWNGAGWSAVGAGMTDNSTSSKPVVNALAYGNSTLYAGGNFDNAGGAPAPSLAAWNGSSWSAVGGGVQACTYFNQPNHCYSTPTAGTVNALLLSGTKLYVGGSFNYVGGQDIWALALWNGSAWSAVGGLGVSNGNSQGSVNAFALNGSTLYVAGHFDHVGGALSSGTPTGTVAAASVASFNGTAWSALGSGANYCSGCGSATVTGLAYWNGRLYMGGNITGAGGDNSPNIGQWNGSAWSAVGPGLDGGLGSSVFLQSSANGVIAAGTFVTAGANTIRLNHVALWNGTAWTGYGLGVQRFGTGNGPVSALGASNHDLYVAGGYSGEGWNTFTTLAHFNGTAWSGVGGGVSGSVSAIAVNGSQVYVGGSFTQAGTVAASNIAMWDGSAWHPLGAGLDGSVTALLYYGGKLWAAGYFTHAGGSAVSDIATWTPSTSKWAPVGGNLHFDGSVYALAGVNDPTNAANNHYVVIGGQFSQVDDGGNPASYYNVNNLVTFNTTASITGPVSGYDFFGSSASPGVTGGANAAVNALYVQGTTVYVGGVFSNTANTVVQNFASVPVNGTTWTNPGGVSDAVNVITGVGSNLYLGGIFTVAGPVNSPAEVEYTPSSSTWTALGSGLGLAGGTVSVNALAQSADGLYAGGNIGLASGRPSSGLALFGATAFPGVTESVTPASPQADSTIAYTATITNPASTSAAGVTLTDSLPSTAEFVSATPSVGTCTKSANTLTCSIGTLAPGASATLTVKVTPIAPGGLGNPVTVKEPGSTYSSSASATASVVAQPLTSYVSVRDSGFTPTALTTVTPGQTVQFNFFGPSQHSVADGSPLMLFASPAVAPVSYWRYTYAAAGTYPVLLDGASTHTMTILGRDALSANSVRHGTTVTVRMASGTSPPSGFVDDLQVLLPGSTTWTTIQNGITTSTVPYTPTAVGTYMFRSQLRNTASGAASGYGPSVTLTAS